ncbi:hypothetical protein ACLB1G_26440 [Oxalobacteraceae bacterium A2-2]
MTPELDRRRTEPATSDTAGWHSLEFLVRQALEVQRDVGTPGAVEFMQSSGISPQVIARVLAPDAKIRAADQEALDNGAPVAELPITSRRGAWRHN